MAVESEVYRSDWPEAGWQTPAVAGMLAGPEDHAARTLSFTVNGKPAQWVAVYNAFESELYGMQVWELRLEAECDLSTVNGRQAGQALYDLSGSLDAFIEGHRCEADYWAAKAVAKEPWTALFLEAGFEPVEHRVLYRTRVRDLTMSGEKGNATDIPIASLSEYPGSDQNRRRDQILALCEAEFAGGGYSRHFGDPVLTRIRPGVEYIVAIMRLNYRRLPSNRFCIAVDRQSDAVCGFTVLGEKSQGMEKTYTQLLSVVHKDFRGLGVYERLSIAALQSLPPEAMILNVTHKENRSIQRAYARHGRRRVADVQLFRRAFVAGALTPLSRQ